jgi:serine/threonine protein kinase
MRIFNLNQLQNEVLRFTTPLPFPEEDKLRYPWLANEDRYYVVEELLGHGGFSLAFRGFPSDSHGQPIPNAQPIVIKVPNLALGYRKSATNTRRRYIEEQSIIEWAVIRKKLQDCKHANLIFDLGSIWITDPLDPDALPIELFATVQPLLKNMTLLRQWLVDQNLRGKITLDEKRKERNWGGIADWTDWLAVSTMIAKGLAEIHRRRVVHADIWPPNIFIAHDSVPYPVFIDFGESFLVMPSGEPHTQPDHCYRAPEREHADSIKTEQVDVYSFGKLMLYFAIGAEELIPKTPGGQRLYGHKRRAWVRKIVFDNNPDLVKERPELLDLIMQCVEVDPVARPAMLEVFDQLHELSTNQLDANIRLNNAVNRINNIASGLHCGLPHSLFIRLIDRKIIEAERLLDSCRTEMVELTGTRDDLIAGLVTLFGELDKGDSWTTLTTPHVWQHNALGLDGRYATATVHAIRRGAAVQRAYAVSVEELGIEWTSRFVTLLRNSESPAIRKLAMIFFKATLDFASHSGTDGYRPKSLDYQRYHQQRFTVVLESICNMISYWRLAPSIYRDEFVGIRSTSGLYVGLVVVPSEAEIRRRRAQNPASLMYLGKEANERDKWLLVMTDIRGRNEDEPLDDRPEVEVIGSSHAPQLRRVRVYKSVMGIPNERILSLQELMKESINLGPIVEELAGYAAGIQ